MDPLGFLTRHFFTPLYEWKNGIRTGPIKQGLLESQYWSEEQIREMQFEKFRETVAYAYDKCRYYRRRFDEAGIKPVDLRSTEDIEAVPRLTKDDIRGNLDDMIAEGHTKDDLIWKRTGGSTGIPVQLYWDEEANTYKECLVFRHNGWAGDIPGTKRAALWGDVSKKLPFRARLWDAIFVRTSYLDTLKMDDETIGVFVEEIRRRSPKIFFGHGHSIYFFSQYLLDHGIDDIKFDGIISSAETLPPSERKVVEQVFGNIVYDRYGCEEVSIIASECEAHDGMHIAAEGIFLEMPGADESTPAELIVTDLVNRGMPLIRYEIGDMATTKSGRCSCGRNLPRLGKVVGRTTDILYTPDGTQVSGVSILDTFTIHIPGFRQVQILQETLGELQFSIVKSDTFSQESENQLASAVSNVFGPNMKFSLNYVDKISRTGRGKFQFSICKIKPEDIR